MTRTDVRTDDAIARATWLPPALIAAVAVVVRIPAFVSAPSLVFDDGQYGVSVVDMRHGLAPYSGVFSSQGPLHFPVLYAGDLLGFRTLDAPRVAPVLAGVFAAIGVWAIARRLRARDSVALVAGLIVATTGTMIWTTGQVTGDGPAAAFTVAALWAAIAFRDRPAWWRAVLAGVWFGAALAVKPLVFPALIPIGWLLWSRRRAEPLVLVGATAVVVWFATALPWGLHRVWRQSVTYHTGKGPEYSKPFQLGKLTSTLGSRDAVLVGAVVLGIVAAVMARRHMRADTTVIAIWTIVVATVLVFEKAMFANHLATIVIPLALLFAVQPPPLRWLAVALVALVPWTVANIYDMFQFRSFHGDEAALVRDLQRLPHGAQAMADDPSFVWRAGLSTPRMMNDISKMRFDQGLLTTSDIVNAARDTDTCAVAIWTFRFGSLAAGLRDALRGAGYTLAHAYSPGHELWLKTPCAVRDPGHRARATAAPVRSLG